MTTLYLCEKHNMATIVGPASHEACERCEVTRLRELLGAAMNWLEDPSAYHGTNEAQDFNRRAREALGWTADPT